MSDLNGVLKICESEIRAGRPAHAARQLSAINTAKVPRELRLPLANLCRRTSLIHQGLRLLKPCVRPDKGIGDSDASPAEFCEYAILLQRNDSIDEALRILATIDAEQVPQAYFVRAFCYFSMWDYEKALPCLEQYVAKPLDPYQLLIGNVNLAAAQVALQKNAEAEILLGTTIARAKEGGYFRIQANCLELRAQLHVLSGRYQSGEADLRESFAVLSQNKTLDELLARKWVAIANGLRNESLKPLDEFRTLAAERKHWESVRDMDRMSLLVKFDSTRFDRLYFGTPHEAYRAKLVRDFNHWPERETLVVGTAKNFLDVATGEFHIGKKTLTPVSQTLQLFQVLYRDHYCPIRIGGLFAALHPNEYFDVHSSPKRIHQAIYRARRWLDENNQPLEISETDGRYLIQTGAELSVHYPLHWKKTDRLPFLLLKLKAKFAPDTDFTAAEALEKLGLRPSTFARLATWALESQQLEKFGAGSATRYYLPSKAA